MKIFCSGYYHFVVTFSCSNVMISKCWEKSPENRPTFTQQVDNFSNLLSSMADYLDVFTITNPTTIPVPSAPPAEDISPLPIDEASTGFNPSTVDCVVDSSLTTTSAPVNPFDDKSSYVRDNSPMLIHETTVDCVVDSSLTTTSALVNPFDDKSSYVRDSSPMLIRETIIVLPESAQGTSQTDEDMPLVVSTSLTEAQDYFDAEEEKTTAL